MERCLKDKLGGGFGRVNPTRSKTMSLIKSTNNKTTERSLRMLMVRAKLKSWRINDRSIKGKPDFFFPCLKLAVFVDGCFWHCCARCGHFPKTHSAFWRAKLIGNRERDRRVNKYLRVSGIMVIRIWEHELVCASGRSKIVARIRQQMARAV
jgi:DNA mismatch endonuclease (patch repair protein)